MKSVFLIILCLVLVFLTLVLGNNGIIAIFPAEIIAVVLIVVTGWIASKRLEEEA